jgi:hypothetical protein
MCPPPYYTTQFDVLLINDLDWVLAGQWDVLGIVTEYLHQSYRNIGDGRYDPLHVVFWACLPKITVVISAPGPRPPPIEIPAPMGIDLTRTVTNYTEETTATHISDQSQLHDLTVCVDFPFGWDAPLEEKEFHLRIGTFHIIKSWCGSFFHALRNPSKNQTAFYTIHKNNHTGKRKVDATDTQFRKSLTITFCDVPNEPKQDYSKPNFTLGRYGDPFEYDIFNSRVTCHILTDVD